MKRLVITLAILASSFALATSAFAAKPSAKSYGGGFAHKSQGFTRSGSQGVGLFGPAGAVHARQSTVTNHHATVQHRSYHSNLHTQYQPQYFGGFGNYGNYGGYNGYGLYDRPVVVGNPYNSFVPASAFGFGPGAIFGW